LPEVNMLRLVHPKAEGQGPRTPKGRRRASPGLSLTPDERRHLAAALHNLRRAFGTWACLADAMRVRIEVVKRGAHRRNPKATPALALLVARTAGMSMETVLSGKLTAAGQCAACGSRLGQGRATA
jgi:hypothetical protein